jgi:hypothetical protein
MPPGGYNLFYRHQPQRSRHCLQDSWLFLLILGILYRFTTSGGRKPGRDLLFWTPRVLILGAAVFVGGFVIDNVFHGRSDFWPALPILLGALMPSYLMLLLLVVSWRWDWLGGRSVSSEPYSSIGYTAHPAVLFSRLTF